MSLRSMMIQCVSDVVKREENTALFLVDIGVWGFRDLLRSCPNRAINAGIFEDGMISVVAGMSLEGITPFVYGISPFILGRAYEQLKLDFCYQKIGGNFITTGAAYDFSTLGYSHYCQEDLDLVRTLPGMEFLAPGSPEEFRRLFEVAWKDGNPTYFRLSDHCNKNSMEVIFGKATVVKQGTKATIIATGTMLDPVLEVCCEEDVTLLYYTTLQPFDAETLRANCSSNKILLVEANYEGALSAEVIKAMQGRSIRIYSIGMPRTICRTYGTKQEKDKALGLDITEIKQNLKSLLEE